MLAHLFNDKKTLASDMSDGNQAFQDLLDGLSTKEIITLRKHKDLIDRVYEIVRMEEPAILRELQEEHLLDLDLYQNGDVWIGTEQLEGSIPAWFETSHCGWFMNREGGEFVGWAKQFLMQEVRINIWIRYLEDLKNPKPESHHGTYL